MSTGILIYIYIHPIAFTWLSTIPHGICPRSPFISAYRIRLPLRRTLLWRTSLLGQACVHLRLPGTRTRADQAPESHDLRHKDQEDLDTPRGPHKHTTPPKAISKRTHIHTHPWYMQTATASAPLPGPQQRHRPDAIVLIIIIICLCPCSLPSCPRVPYPCVVYLPVCSRLLCSLFSTTSLWWPLWRPRHHGPAKHHLISRLLTHHIPTHTHTMPHHHPSSHVTPSPYVTTITISTCRIAFSELSYVNQLFLSPATRV